MTYIDASFILLIFETCNRFDQFLRLIKRNIYIRNFFIFFSHEMKFLYIEKSIKNADHVK